MDTVTLELPTSLYAKLQSLAAREHTHPVDIVERWVNAGLPPAAETIIVDPRLRGGRPIIAGTGTTVRTVASHYKLGLSPEEIAAELPALTLAQVYAALAYYHLHADEIEADIRADAESVLMQEAKPGPHG